MDGNNMTTVRGGVCAMAPERVHRMTSDRFIQIMHALNRIEQHELPSFDGHRWRMFRIDPCKFLKNAFAADIQAIWDALPDHLRQ
jgi:hypothetical protein